MIDLRLPRPFMKPEAWPDPQRVGGSWILSLDLSIVSGGPLRSYCQRVLEGATKIIWSIQSETLLSDLRLDPGLLEEARSWLKKTQGPIRLHVDPGKKAAVMAELLLLHEPFDMIERVHMPAPDVLEWLEELAPEFSRKAAGEGVETRKMVSDYESELGHSLQSPWLDLGYFAGFLRRRGYKQLAELFHYEWSRAQAYYSPQDDESERKRLQEGEVILNPTAQIVRRTLPYPSLRVVARYSGALMDVELNPVQAALIDEMNEGFRLQVSDVLAGAEKTLKQVQHNISELQCEFDSLVEKGILLKGTRP